MMLVPGKRVAQNVPWGLGVGLWLGVDVGVGLDSAPGPLR
jgi:hypothetical protein